MQMQYDEDESGKMRSGLDIAVIGAVGRFPGADNIDEFWDNLKNGVESITFFSDQELLAAGVSAAELEQPGYVKAKGYMTDIEYFDAGFFGFSPQEAEKLDPQTRILHESIWHLLEQAGYDPYTYDGAVGCFLGARNNTPWQLKVYLSSKGDAAETFDLYNLSDKDQISTRISYKLNLTGPSFQLVTQCSTSLVVVHEACRSLIHGECDMAAAGGISVTIPLEHGYLYQEGMLHSQDGHLRAFNAGASGTVFGNGAGVVLLKPMEQAVADNDHIMAVIKSTFINNDGNRKVGYTAPSVEGQAEVIKTALELADVKPETIGYIEAHGTATSIGDIVEFDALILAFNTAKKHFCRIGTVKTNIGHLGISAGIAGFIKTVLALKHRLIPPCLHFETSNPKIDFENSPFLVNRELYHWRPGRDPLRAGVSAFGVGGTNVHVILEEWPHAQGAKRREQGAQGQARGGVFPPYPSPRYQLILLSAKTTAALDKMTENLARYFKENTVNHDNHENSAIPGLALADAAYTLQVGRSRFPHRLAFVCANTGEAAAVLGNHRGYKTFTNHSTSPPAIIFMFPGQGAQYVNMGWDLYCTQPVFREEMDRCFEILKPIMNDDIKEILYPVYRSDRSNKSYKSHINQTEIAQPLLFSFEYALARLLMSWGVLPFALIGHSVGEYTAACLSGVFSLDHGLALVAARGQLMQKLPNGSMLGVPLSEAEVMPLLSGNISLAAVNTSSRCVVSGAAADIEAFHRFLAAQGHRCTRLHTSHAFHSPMINPVLIEFQMKVENILLHPPGLPYISNITGDWVKESEAVSPGYWTNHLREPVQFARGMETLEAMEMESAIFLEVGPGNALGTFARQSLQREKERFVINLVRHPQKKTADDDYLLDQMAEYWLYNGDLDWQGFHRGVQRRRIPLPAYPFQRQRYWIDENPSGEYGLPGTALPAEIKKTNGLPGKITNLPGEKQVKKKKNRFKPRPNLTVPYRPPSPGDKTVETLVVTWKNYFGFDKVGIHDDFFELGGDSLKAITMMALLQKAMQVEIPAGEFFQRLTPAELADYINHHAVKGQYVEVPADEKKEYYELSAVQGRMYVLQRMKEENITYNEFFALQVEGKLNKDRVEGTFLKLIEQHESFRTCFRLLKGEPVQKIIPYNEIDFAVKYFHVRGGAVQDKANAVDKIIRDFIRPFDLTEAPLIRTALIKTGPEAHIFVVDIHHIITDGTSHGILIENFLDLYHDGEVTVRRTRYKDFSRWQNRVLRSGGMKEQENYWLKEFAVEAPVLNLPLDYSRPGFLTFAGNRVKDRLESREVTALRQLAAAREATLFMALLAAFNVCLYKLTGQEDIVCGTVIAGRQRAEFQDIIGMFVNTLALRNYPRPRQTFSQFLRTLAKNALLAYENQDYPLEALVEKAVKHRVPGRNPLFDVTFALLNVEIPAVQMGGLHITPYECENITAKFDLSFMVFEVDDYLVLNVEYNTGLFKKETVKRFIGFYKRVVACILECPEQEITGIEIMGAEEKVRLLWEFNNTAGEFPREQTLHRVFAGQAHRSPGQTAVSHCLDITAVYDELESAQFNEDCCDRLEKCCFSVNPHVFQFTGNRFLKALGLFDEAELEELVLVKTHRENYAAVNPLVLRLLASLKGRTNLKSIVPALVNKNMEFRVHPLVIDLETGQVQGKPGKFPATSTADMILLFKALYRANLIELKNYQEEMEPWHLADEGEETLWPLTGEGCEKQGSRQESNEELTGPVLLLGDRAAAASTGLLYLASFLRRHGIEAYCQWNNLSKTRISLKENILSLLTRFQPRVVGVSMKWFPHIARVLEICRIVKNYNPLIRVVVGGNTAAYYRDKIIQYDDIDYVVKGDGEVPFLKICYQEKDIPNCLYKKNGKIIETPIDYVQNEENSAEVYLSHLEEIFVSPLDPFLVPCFYINTGKGCSRQCFYCAGCQEVQEKIFNRRKPFLRGVEEVRKDIAAAKIYTGCFMFDFDLPLYDSLDYYKKIWEGLDLSGYFCKFYFWLLPGGGFIDLVAKTFKYVYINIDLCSLSESHRQGLASRGLVKPQPGDDELFDFFDRCEKYSNISVIINHINGLPYFSYDDIKTSEGIISRLMEYRCFQGMDWGRLHVQPGAPIAADPGKYNMFSYAGSYEDFLHYSQLNLQEDIYPELFNFHYPYIYFNDNKLNSAITRFYAESEQKVLGQGKKKRRNLTLVRSMTYEQLDSKSNRLARVLRERGIFAESIVGLYLECSLDMMVGLLAILKAGGTYLHLAVNLPVQRALYMLSDCKAGVLLTQGNLAGSFAANGFPGEIINISGKELYMNREDVELPETAAPGGAAYIIYTSGSTGRPKGVVVEHRNVLRLVKNSNYIHMSQGDKLLLTGAFGFDITTFEVWGSLLNGVRLFLAHQDTILDEIKLGEILWENKISILHLIPQLFNRLADRDPGIFTGLRYLLVGGDLVSPLYVNKIRNRYPALKILHMYGPTENTTFSTFFLVEKDYEITIPIGSPIKNSTVYIINSMGGFQPIGVVGEIVVGGEGIARGYLNNPVLTCEKFKIINYKLKIKNVSGALRADKNAFGEREAHELHKLPPIETTSNEKLLWGVQGGGFLEKSPPGSRRQVIYKTGDLGRWLADGTIEFLGRQDSQVKVRGFRIEPGEIEVCLLSHPAIKQAVVLLADKEDRDRYLCAYIVSGIRFNVTELREYLAGKLPDYMIPADFFQVDQVPLTTNGKVDRRALMGLAKKLAPGAEYAAPRSDNESLMADIWKEVLQVEEVGIYDNFFELGGTSMDIVRVHSQLRDAMDKNISIVSLYRYTTIDAFSRFMGSEEAGENETPGGDVERGDVIRRGKAEKARMREKRMRRSQ